MTSQTELYTLENIYKMATSGEKTVPSIPKRPKVIRQSSSTGSIIPALHAASPSPMPARSCDSVPLKPQASSDGHHPHIPPVKPVDKPTAIGKKRPEITIVCARPMAEVGFRDSKLDMKPSLPKPPENTAPMVSLDVNNGLITDKALNVVPKPFPRISPRGNNTNTSSDNGSIPPKPRPSLPRHSVIKSDTIPGDDVSESKIGKNINNNAVTAGPSQHMLQPEVPSTSPITYNPNSQHMLPAPSPSHRDLPGVPSRPAVSITSTNKETSDIFSPQPLVSPSSLLPRNPTARIKLLPNLSSRSSAVCYTNSQATSDLIIQEDKFTNPVINSGLKSSDNVYVAISKPNRPTIIRPNKPNVNEDNGQPSGEGVNVIKSEIIVPPKVVTNNHVKANDKQKTDDRKFMHQSENESSNVNPEFLRTRLKKTVPDKICSIGNHFNSNTTAESSEHKTSVDQETHSVVRGIPPAIKPKPLTFPKPAIAIKPTTSINSCSSSKIQQDEQKGLDSVQDKCNEQTVINVSEKDDASAIAAEVKTPVIKRPTIIRPARQSLMQSCNLETLNQSSNNAGGDHWTRNVNDNTNACNSQSVLKPPSPSKRPESMSVLQLPSPSKKPDSMKNISETVADGENKYEKVIKLDEFKSDNDVGNSVQSKPIPRAAARRRPMSMAVLPVSRPILPTVGPKISQSLKSNSSPPPRPHICTKSKLPQKLDTDVEISERTSDQGVAPSLPASTLQQKAESVALHKAVQRPPPPKQVPRVAEMSSSDEEASTLKKKAESVAPHKAVQRPPPPKQVPRVAEMSSSDEETSMLPQKTESVAPHTAVQRPPPPKQVPRVAKKSSSDEEELCLMATEKPGGPPEILSNGKQKDSSIDKSKKPSRPCAPPAAVRELNTTQKETEDKHLELRPSDTSHRPSRPLSMPLKFAQPNHAKSEKSHAQGMVKQVSPPSNTPCPNHPSDQHTLARPHGIALFDFKSSHDDELDFKVGDVITLVRSVDVNWLVGKIGTRQGIFPCNFIDVKVPLPQQGCGDFTISGFDGDRLVGANSDKPDNIGYGPRCIAHLDCLGEGPDDLVFNNGDVIRLLERVGVEWRIGELNGRTGLLPLKFVEIIEDLPVDGTHTDPNLVKAASGLESSNNEELNIKTFTGHQCAYQPHGDTPYCIALYDYVGQTDDDLSFLVGDSILLVERINSDWLKGKLGGKIGMFPSAFVEIKIDFADTNGQSLQTHTPEQAIGHEESLQTHTTRQTTGHEESLQTHTTGQTTSHKESLQTHTKGQTIGYEESLQTHTTGQITGHEESLQTHTAVQKLGIALYDFEGGADNELIFKAGDQLVIEDFVDGSEDWQWGLIDGRRGMFPVTFVQEIK